MYSSEIIYNSNKTKIFRPTIQTDYHDFDLKQIVPAITAKDDVTSFSPAKPTAARADNMSLKWSANPSFLNFSPSRVPVYSSPLWSQDRSPNKVRHTGEALKQSAFRNTESANGNRESKSRAKVFSGEKSKMAVNLEHEGNFAGFGQIHPDEKVEVIPRNVFMLIAKEVVDLAYIDNRLVNWQSRLLEKAQRMLELIQNEYTVLKYCRELYQKFSDNDRSQKIEIEGILDGLYNNQDITSLKDVLNSLFPAIVNLSKKISSYSALGLEIKVQADSYNKEIESSPDLAASVSDKQIVDIDSSIILLMGAVGKEQETLVKCLEDYKLYLRQKPNTPECEECAHTLLLAMKNARPVYLSSWDQIVAIYIAMTTYFEYHAAEVITNSEKYKIQADKFNDAKYEISEAVEINKKITIIDEDMIQFTMKITNLFKILDKDAYLLLQKPEDWKENLRLFKETSIQKRQALKDYKSTIRKLADPSQARSNLFQNLRFSLRDSLEESAKKAEIKCDLVKALVEILESLIEVEKELVKYAQTNDQLNKEQKDIQKSQNIEQAVSALCTRFNVLIADYGSSRKKVVLYENNPQYRQFLGMFFEKFIAKIDERIRLITAVSENLLKEKFKDTQIEQEITNLKLPEYKLSFKRFVIDYLTPEVSLDYTKSEEAENHRKELDSTGRKKLNALEQLLRKCKDPQVKLKIKSIEIEINEILKYLKTVADLFEAGIKIHELNLMISEYSMDMQNEELKGKIGDTTDLINQYNVTLSNYRDNLMAVSQMSKPMNTSVSSPNFRQTFGMNQSGNQFQSPGRGPNMQASTTSANVLASILEEKENPLPVLCNIAFLQNNLFISIYKKILSYFYKELKELNMVEQSKYQSLLVEKFNKFMKDITSDLQELSRLQAPNKQEITLFKNCLENWKKFVSEVKDTHDSIDRENRFIKVYSDFIGLTNKNKSIYNYDTYPELLKQLDKIISTTSAAERKQEQAKNCYADLVFLNQILKPFVDKQFNALFVYLDFLDPTSHTIVVTGILEIIDQTIQVITKEKPRLYSSKFNELMMTWATDLEGLYIALQKTTKNLQQIKGSFSEKIEKSGFKDLAEFYAEVVKMYKTVVALQIDNDPYVVKFPKIKRRVSLVSSFQEKYAINDEKIDLFEQFVFSFQEQESARAELFWYLNDLSKFRSTLTGRESRDVKLKLKDQVRPFATSVENLRNYYIESTKTVALNQLKLLNPGINHLITTMEQVIFASEKVVNAFSVIINAQLDQAVEAAYVKLEREIALLNAGEDYTQLVSELGKLVSTRAGEGADEMMIPDVKLDFKP